MQVQVDELMLGDRLTQDVFNSYGVPVLAANTVLDQDALDLLYKHRIDEVMIERKPEALTSSYYKTEHMRHMLVTFERSLESIKTIFEKCRSAGQITDADVEEGFVPFIGSFKNETDIVSLLLLLNNKDDYTYYHCVHVGMISYFIAKWMGMPEYEALRVGKAGYLHDIGKSRVNSDILNKSGKLTDEEFEEMKRHTVYGYDIIKKSLELDDQEEYALTALQHHERLHGKGYPLGKTAAHIHPFAKIVAVADIYSAMITTRVYQKKRDLLVVLKEIHRCSFGELDATVAHTFIKHMIPNFIGKQVVLNDGRQGKIVMTNATDYFRPLVQVQEEFIDLSHQSSLDIVDITM